MNFIDTCLPGTTFRLHQSPYTSRQDQKFHHDIIYSEAICYHNIS